MLLTMEPDSIRLTGYQAWSPNVEAEQYEPAHVLGRRARCNGARPQEVGEALPVKGWGRGGVSTGYEYPDKESVRAFNCTLSA